MRRRRPNGLSRSGGWTLVELTAGLALAGVVLSMAVPGYGDWIGAAELAGRAQRLASGITFARSEAIKRGGRVNLCRTGDGRHCAPSGGGESGRARVRGREP